MITPIRKGTAVIGQLSEMSQVTAVMGNHRIVKRWSRPLDDCFEMGDALLAKYMNRS